MDAIDDATEYANGSRDLKKFKNMMPLPEGYEERTEPAAEFGNLRVYYCNPYSTVLSDAARLREKGAESYRIASEEINLERMVEVFVGVLDRFK